MGCRQPGVKSGAPLAHYCTTHPLAVNRNNVEIMAEPAAGGGGTGGGGELTVGALEERGTLYTLLHRL